MALSKQDRIVFSKKVVSSSDEIASIDKAKEQLLVVKAKALETDNAHKNLFDPKNLLTTSYENEIKYLDGNIRISPTETDFQNAANLLSGNYFYPITLGALPPSLSAPWNKTKPYALNIAVGKKYNETYDTTTAEPSLISLITSAISSIETTYQQIQRVTGQTCTTVSTPPPPVDTISTLTQLHTDLTDLITKVQNWKTFLQTESSSIYTLDSNTTRKTESIAAKNNIDLTVIPAINTWLAYTNFNTAHGQTTCTGFFAYNPNSLGATKLRVAELNALKTTISNRSAFILTRVSQLTNYLGTLSQNLSTGDVSGSGLYYERYSIINLRLNLLNGSLIEYNSFDKAISAQQDQQSAITSALTTYQSVIKAAKFLSSATGTEYVQMASVDNFNVGDQVYLTTDTQEEIVRNIVEISGKRIKFSQPVPAKYRETDYGRIYKDA
jgi:hypothetical protein